MHTGSPNNKVRLLEEEEEKFGGDDPLAELPDDLEDPGEDEETLLQQTIDIPPLINNASSNPV